MARLRHILAGCVLTLAGLGSSARTAATAADSVDRAVAVSIASNIKLAIANALQRHHRHRPGGRHRRAPMLPALLPSPTTLQEHDAAVAAIDNAINSLTARHRPSCWPKPPPHRAP